MWNNLKQGLNSLKGKKIIAKNSTKTQNKKSHLEETPILTGTSYGSHCDGVLLLVITQAC
jgi:hypothetical protein